VTHLAPRCSRLMSFTSAPVRFDGLESSTGGGGDRDQ
jgi:hypothetical protein